MTTPASLFTQRIAQAVGIRLDTLHKWERDGTMPPHIRDEMVRARALHIMQDKRIDNLPSYITDLHRYGAYCDHPRLKETHNV